MTRSKRPHSAIVIILAVLGGTLAAGVFLCHTASAGNLANRPSAEKHSARARPSTTAKSSSPSKVTPADISASFYNDGLAAAKALHWSDAQDDFRQAATLNPKNPMALAKLGLTFIAQGKPIDAIDWLHKAWLATTDKDLDARRYISSAYALNQSFLVTQEQQGEKQWFVAYIPTLLAFIKRSGGPDDYTDDCPNLAYIYTALAKVGDVRNAPSFMTNCARKYALPSDYPVFAPSREYLLTSRGQLTKGALLRNQEVAKAIYLQHPHADESDKQYGPIEHLDAVQTQETDNKFDDGCIYVGGLSIDQMPLNPVYLEIFPNNDLKRVALIRSRTCALNALIASAYQAYEIGDMRTSTKAISRLIPVFAAENNKLWSDDRAKLNDPGFARVGITEPAVRVALKVGNIDAADAINSASRAVGQSGTFDPAQKSANWNEPNTRMCATYPRDELIDAIKNNRSLETVAGFYSADNRFLTFRKQKIGGYDLLAEALGCYFSAVSWPED